MATAEQYADWIVRNQDKRGTPEFETVAQAYKAVRGQSEPKQGLKLNAEDVPSFGESMLIGAGRTFDRVGKGMQQLYYGATGNDSELSKLKAQAAADDDAYSALRSERPWATGIGEALPAVAIGPGAGSASLVGNMGRMAVTGAIPGALEYGSAGERAGRAAIGGIAGAALPALGVAAKSALSFAEPLFAAGRNTIAGRTLNRAAGLAAEDVRRRLATAAPIVAGSMPTAGQVAESGGIAALERMATQANPEAFSRRAMEQSAARVNALRGIAGSDAAINAATSAREDVAGALYKAAFENQAALTPSQLKAQAELLASKKLEKLAARPAIQQAMQMARDNAGNAGRAMDNPQGSINGLHQMKMALDDMLKEPATAAQAAKVDAIRTAKNDLVNVIETLSPTYAKARTTYAAMSEPINRMKVGNALLDKLQPALADYGALASDTGATFARALRDGDGLVRSATGTRAAGGLMDVLDQQQRGLLDNIATDLGRKANAQNLGRGVGSNTFQNLSQQNIAAQSGMPRLVGGLLGNTPGVSRATAWAYRETDQKIQDVLADAILNPAKAAELMAKADKRWLGEHPSVRQALEQAAMRGGGLLGTSAASQAFLQ